MRTKTKAQFFLLFLILSSSELFSQRYQISGLSYTLDSTRERDLQRVVPVNTDKIFDSREELDSYLQDLQQRLMNTRAFNDVEIIIENQEGEVSPAAAIAPQFSPAPSAGVNDSLTTAPATPPNDNQQEIISVFLQIKANDSKHLLILPYPKYDSNEGLIFKIKVKDVNFAGTMNTMDIGFFAGLKEDLQTGDQNLTMGTEFKYSYPFYADPFICSWNNKFELKYTRGIEELEFWSGSGLTFELPFQRFSLVLDVEEEANRDLEYEIFKDSQYFTSNVKLSMPVKVLDIENWGYIFWTPFIDGKVSYDRDGISIKNDDLASPVISAGQTLSTGRINWYGNFRNGISARIGHSQGYDFMQKEIEPRIFAEIQAFKSFKYAAFNTRFSFFTTKSNRSEIGNFIRGVRDDQKYINYGELELVTKKALKTPSALVLNVDFPFHIISTHWLDWADSIFGEDSWFSHTFAWTDKFNFELQASPFLDIVLTKNEITGRYFSFKDGWYTGGLEFLVFPERWKGIVMRASVGMDLGRAVISKKYPKKIDMSWREKVKKYEIYAGIGLHY